MAGRPNREWNPIPKGSPTPVGEGEEAVEGDGGFVTDGQKQQTPAAPPGKLTQIEAVRRLLAEDPDLLPKRGVELLQSRFAVAMNTSTFSNYKSSVRKEQEGEQQPRKVGRPAGPVKTATPAPTAPQSPPPPATPRSAPAPTPTPTAGSTVELVVQLKGLLKKHPPQEIIALVEALSSD